MAHWRIAHGPKEFSSTSDGADIDVGWAWTIRRDGADERVVRVEVAGGRLHAAGLPDEAKRAIGSHGRSAVHAVLGEVEPPARIVVSSRGVRPKQP